MHQQVEKLHALSKKSSRLILGLMSGTSLDGLDIALCRITGADLDTKVELLEFETVSYDTPTKEKIRSVFAKKHIDFEYLTLLNPWIGFLHADMILHCLTKWHVNPQQVDLIASHGQTVYHAPKSLHGLTEFSNATLQIGDGDHMACRTGILTISDFRQKHIASGGEGAPLAVYGDFLLFSSNHEDRILLNMGGIANFTWLPAGKDPAKCFVTDTGPGNTMMDAAVQKFFPDMGYDQDGMIAKKGTVSQPLLKALKKHSFFTEKPPKTTGPELFNMEYLAAAQVQSHQQQLLPADILATLARFSAETICDAILDTAPGFIGKIFASGGGYHNPVLMDYLRTMLPHASFHSTDLLGVLPDAKEAVLFAILANQTVAGSPISFSNLPSVTLGKISFPA